MLLRPTDTASDAGNRGATGCSSTTRGAPSRKVIELIEQFVAEGLP